jgi:LuxR family maltose regulon positive regulatory protein
VRVARDNTLAPLFRRHARRPRLTALLEEATAQAILLTAPAGYGKTTLAREWLQGREHVAWYRATAASADVGAFSVGLADAVAPLVPGAGERVRQRLRVGDATERLARPLAELLSEDLEEWPAGGIVVLDDYHLLAESTPVEDFVDWLLALAPIRVLVTTRRRPKWATGRRFLYDEAVEIGRDQLAMTDEEATRVLKGRSTEAVRALVRQAEGWPAVIGLAALSVHLAFPDVKASESLYRYFAEEVLRAEPPEVQRFMLAASIPVSVGVRIAEEVLGLEDPGPLLERLHHEDLLHEIPAGDLVFHPLIRDFLRRRHEANDPQGSVELTRRVIDDALAHDRWEEAFELAVQAGWTSQAAEIVGRAARTLLALGQSETLEKWLAACGAAGVTVPGAALARAELLIRQGEMSAAAALARDTAARLEETHEDFAWASNVAGKALHFMSKEEEAFARFEIARNASQTDEDTKDALWGLLLVITELAPDRMATYLDELEARFSDDLDVRLRVAVGRYGIAEQTPSVAGEWSRFAVLLDSLEHSRNALASTSFLAMASASARLGGDYTLSIELADRAIRMCRDLRFDLGLGASLLHRASAEIGLRAFASAQRSLREFERTLISREDPFYRLEGLTIKTRLYACQGDVKLALETGEELAAVSPPPRALGSYLAVQSILLATCGDAERARWNAAQARENGSSIEMIYCSLLGEVIAEDIDGTHEQFRALAADAVVQCSQAGYVDGLVFAYRVYPPLLDSAHESRPAASVLSRLLSKSRDYELARSASIEVQIDDADSPLGALTPREQEVLRLLTQGLTNPEIATRLFIAPGTAKVHVRHILEKLGARNRLQAVIRAQELLDSAKT